MATENQSLITITETLSKKVGNMRFESWNLQVIYEVRTDGSLALVIIQGQNGSGGSFNFNQQNNSISSSFTYTPEDQELLTTVRQQIALIISSNDQPTED